MQELLDNKGKQCLQITRLIAFCYSGRGGMCYVLQRMKVRYFVTANLWSKIPKSLPSGDFMLRWTQNFPEHGTVEV